jgi:lipopolysaccharide transport system permease protein
MQSQHEMPQDPLPVAVYEPQAALGGLFKTAGVAYDEIRRSRFLIWKLFIRDFQSQFRQKLFGYLWAFIAPIMTIFSFVLLQFSGILNPGDTGVPYPIYVFIGVAIWNFMASTISAVSSGLITQSDLILRTNIPRITLAVASLAQIAYNFTIHVLVVVAFMTFFSVKPTLWSLLYLPALLPMFVLGTAIGLFISVIGTIARDIGGMVQSLLSLLVYLTPVIYVASTIQNRMIQTLIWLNPLSYLVEFPRALLLYGGSNLWAEYFLVTGLCFLALLVAIKSFYTIQDLVAERL